MIPFRAFQAMHSAEAKARAIASKVRPRRLSSGTTGRMSAMSEDRRWREASWTG